MSYFQNQINAQNYTIHYWHLVNSIEFRQAQLNLLNAELSRNQAKFATKLAELDLLQISGQLLDVEF